MAEVLFDKDGVRVVLLNRKFDLGGRDQQELRVRFTEGGVMFFHFSQDGEPKKYGLSAAEADAFCESWLAHRTEQKAKEQAEQEHLQAMVADAYALAAEYPAIQIEEHPGYYKKGEPAWKVSVPSLAWGHQGPVGSPTELLELVRGARDAFQSHIKLMAAS